MGKWWKKFPSNTNELTSHHVLPCSFLLKINDQLFLPDLPLIVTCQHKAHVDYIYDVSPCTFVCYPVHPVWYLGPPLFLLDMQLVVPGGDQNQCVEHACHQRYNPYQVTILPKQHFYRVSKKWCNVSNNLYNIAPFFWGHPVHGSQRKMVKRVFEMSLR